MCLVSRRPSRCVVFVSLHDTDRFIAVKRDTECNSVLRCTIYKDDDRSTVMCAVRLRFTVANEEILISLKFRVSCRFTTLSVTTRLLSTNCTVTQNPANLVVQCTIIYAGTLVGSIIIALFHRMCRCRITQQSQRRVFVVVILVHRTTRTTRRHDVTLLDSVSRCRRRRETNSVS